MQTPDQTVEISKQEAIDAYGGGAEGVQKLADALKITRAAIYGWSEGPIPNERALQLRFILKPSHSWGQEAPESPETATHG